MGHRAKFLIKFDDVKFCFNCFFLFIIPFPFWDVAAHNCPTATSLIRIRGQGRVLGMGVSPQVKPMLLSLIVQVWLLLQIMCFSGFGLMNPWNCLMPALWTWFSIVCSDWLLKIPDRERPFLKLVPQDPLVGKASNWTFCVQSIWSPADLLSFLVGKLMVVGMFWELQSKKTERWLTLWQCVVKEFVSVLFEHNKGLGTYVRTAIFWNIIKNRHELQIQREKLFWKAVSKTPHEKILRMNSDTHARYRDCEAHK